MESEIEKVGDIVEVGAGPCPSEFPGRLAIERIGQEGEREEYLGPNPARIREHEDTSGYTCEYPYSGDHVRDMFFRKSHIIVA